MGIPPRYELTRTTSLLAELAWENLQRQVDDWSRVFEETDPNIVTSTAIVLDDEQEAKECEK